MVLFGGGAGRLCGVRLLYEVASSILRARYSDFACPLHWATFTNSSQFLPGIWLSARVWGGKTQGRMELVPPAVGGEAVRSEGGTGLRSFPCKMILVRQPGKGRRSMPVCPKDVCFPQILPVLVVLYPLTFSV